MDFFYHNFETLRRPVLQMAMEILAAGLVPGGLSFAGPAMAPSGSARTIQASGHAHDDQRPPLRRKQRRPTPPDRDEAREVLLGELTVGRTAARSVK